MEGIELEPEEIKELVTRLRKVEGQVRGLQAMISEGRDCEDVVTQFAAAIKALEHAGYRFFAAALAECATNPENAEAAGYTRERLERMFLRLT